MKTSPYNRLATKGSLALGLALFTASIHAQSPPPARTPVTLRNASLPATIKQQLETVIVNELAESGDTDIVHQHRSALDSWVSFVRLRHAAPQAILLEPSEGAEQLCAANGNGNCPSWLFLRSGKRAVLVLEDHGQGISVAKTSHNGMRDLVTTYRIGHTPITLEVVVLHFNGKIYKSVSCSESTKGGDEDDTEIPPHPCAVPGNSE